MGDEAVGMTRDEIIAEDDRLGLALSEVLVRLWRSPVRSRCRSLTITRLQEAMMWLGMDQREQNGEI